MRSFSILLLLLLALPAFAGNVVLLSSVKLSKLAYHRMESRFKKEFKNSGHNIIIHRKTTPEILHRILSDEETEVLIWVSHAGGAQSDTPGMASKGVIIDHFGNDVKNFFTTTKNNLKFLGIVGCSAKSIFQGFKERGHFADRPNLEVHSYSEKVLLLKGLKETLKLARVHLDKELTSSDEVNEDEIEIQLSVESERTGFSWLEFGEKVYPLHEGLAIKAQDWGMVRNKNIRHVRDLSIPGNLPKLKLLSIEGNWNLFAKKDGTPIGSANNHLYLFKP